VTSKSTAAGTGPGEGVALAVGDGDHRVVEGRVDVRDPVDNRALDALAGAGGWLGH